MKRDPNDPAKLLVRAGRDRRVSSRLRRSLARLTPRPMRTARRSSRNGRGRKSVAFADSWSVGMSFYHNVFAREHNAIIDEFRRMAQEHPDADSGLRNPAAPAEPIAWAKISDEELFQVARLIVAAEIAKIHTIEWTTQLLYDEPLNLGMNSNWSGLFEDDTLASEATKEVVAAFAESDDPIRRNQLYSAFAAGAGHRRPRQQQALSRPSRRTGCRSTTGISPTRTTSTAAPTISACPSTSPRSSPRSTGSTRSCPTCSSSATLPTPTPSSAACRSSTRSAARRPRPWRRAASPTGR